MKTGSSSCLDVFPVVQNLPGILEEWAQDPLGTVLLDAGAVELVRASPMLHLLCRHLEVVFAQMARYWTSYVAPWLTGGRLDPEAHPELKHVLSNTPFASFFEESFFNMYKDDLRIVSIKAAPWKVRQTTLSRTNDSVDRTMLDEDVPRVMRLAREVFEGREIVREFRCQLAARRRLQAEKNQVLKQRKERERGKRWQQQSETE